MIDLGDVYRIAVDVKDAAGVLTSPASATLTVTLPDGTAASPTVPLPPAETGRVVVDYPTVQAGRHVVRLTTTSPQTAYTDVLDVRPAAPDLIVSLKDAREQINFVRDPSPDDEELRSLIEGVAGPIEDYVGAVARRTEIEVFDGGQSTVLLSHIPLISVTEVRDSGTVLDPSAYTVNTASGVLTRVSGTGRYCFRPGIQSLQVIYVAGRVIIPANVRMAALITIQHIWDTQRPAGAGAFTQGTDDFDPRYTYSIPRRALELLGEPAGGLA